MNKNTRKQELGILDLLLALKSKLWLILAVTFVFAAMGFVISNYGITPQYEASMDMIVNTHQNPGNSVTNDNITSAKNLVDTYAVIIKSNTVLNQVIEKLEMDCSYEKLYDKISVHAINNTPIMKISVRHSDPELAVRIIKTISDVAPGIVVDVVEAGSCKVVSQISLSEEPVYPDVKKNTFLAGFLGLVVIIGILLVKELLDDYITDETDVQNKLDVPVLGIIPEDVRLEEDNLRKTDKKKQKVKMKKERQDPV